MEKKEELKADSVWSWSGAKPNRQTKAKCYRMAALIKRLDDDCAAALIFQVAQSGSRETMRWVADLMGSDCGPDNDPQANTCAAGGIDSVFSLLDEYEVPRSTSGAKQTTVMIGGVEFQSKNHKP